jgi:hypothetical protein
MFSWKNLKENFLGFVKGYAEGAAALQVTPKNVFTIDRKTWLRGEGLSFSSLLRIKDHKRCCLGFYCQSLGVPDEDMLGVGQPNLLPPAVQKKLNLYDSWFFEPQSHIRCWPPMPSKEIQDLIRVNDKLVGDPTVRPDNAPLTEKYREKRIKEIFAEHGVEVRFIN